MEKIIELQQQRTLELIKLVDIQSNQLKLMTGYQQVRKKKSFEKMY